MRLAFILFRTVLLSAFALPLVACDRGSTPSPRVGSDSISQPGLDSALEVRRTSDDSMALLSRDEVSGVQVLVSGTVVRFLSDDTVGDRHQRFILELRSGQTLLVAHNVDLAARIPQGARGKIVYASGVYEWNSEGGLVHWTHRDPSRVHPDGWLQFLGDRFW